jgi:Na+(H+)/acetate symporter ActP
MDGALYAIGPLVAFYTVLLIIAEPLRNTGTYTVGDVIYYRMKGRRLWPRRYWGRLLSISPTWCRRWQGAACY